MRYAAWSGVVDRNPAVADLVFAAFDTETTGCGPMDHLVEIAAVKFQGNAVLEEISLLVDPGTPIPPSASAIHGITDDMVRGACGAAEALQEFFRFAADAVWIAHNAPFDASVIAGEMYRAGILPPEDPILDTLRQSRRTIPAASHSLESLVRTLDLPADEHHRALPDARHVFRLFSRICADLAPGGRPTLGQVLEANGPTITVGEYLPQPPDLPDRFGPLREAAESSLPVLLLYAPAEGSPGYRRVTPKVFYRRDEVIYMEAFCHATETRRCYRLDRIRAFRTDDA